FAAKLPAYVMSLYNLAAPFLMRAAAAAGIDDTASLAQTFAAAVERVVGPMTTLASGLLGHGLAFINVALLLAITPLVAFYLLRDWPRLLAEIDGWLPLDHAETIRAQARAVDHVLAGFARGTAIVGTVFGLVTSVGVALYQFWPRWAMVTVVLGIFLAGQLLSDYVLTPRLVGNRIGLH